MKYYVDIIYIMIVNGVVISNDKNKNIMKLKNIVKTADGLTNVKKANGLKSIKGSGLKILK